MAGSWILRKQGLLSLMKADFGGPDRALQYLWWSHQDGKFGLFIVAHGEDNNINANKRGSDQIYRKCSLLSSQTSMGTGCPPKLDSLHPWRFSRVGWLKPWTTAFGLINHLAWSRRLDKCSPKVHSKLNYPTILRLSVHSFQSTDGMSSFWPDPLMWELL